MRLLPREEEFFDLFVEVATRGEKAAELLHQLFTNPDRAAYCAEAIKRLENEADEITHEVVNRLDRTFITPIDREDIHLLASDLDDVIDRIDGTARRAQIFRLGAVAPPGIAQLCDVIRRMTAEIVQAVRKLRGKDDVMRHCVEAKRLEEEGDALYHQMLGRLFDTEKDPLEIIKWKEIYDNLETTIDEGEDVANDIESIVLKNA